MYNYQAKRFSLRAKGPRSDSILAKFFVFNMKFRKEEEYIIGQSPEVETELYPRALKKFFVVFPALINRNYRLYFGGQLISLIGTWLQIVAQGWLIFRITNSAFMVGSVAAATMTPTLIFSLFGGVIVDRFPKRQIIIFTQGASMILAFILGGLVIFKMVNVTQIIILSFLLGTVTAVDSPARQAFVIEMVGREHLASAIALNSGVFNAARVIGPSIAGLLIAWIGEGGAFVLNGISYIAVIIALFYIKTESKVAKNSPRALRAIKEGIIYSLKNNSIKNLLIYTAVVSVFGWTFTTLFPVIIKEIFRKDAAYLGYFYTAVGLGAMVSTVLISAFSRKIKAAVFIFGGSALFTLSIFAFSLTRNFSFTMFFLFFAGLGLLSQFSTINTSLQHLVEDNLRGRVMSIYTLMFIGLSPLGNLQVGFMAQRFGTYSSIQLGAIIIFLFSAFVFIKTEGKLLKKACVTILKTRPKQNP